MLCSTSEEKASLVPRLLSPLFSMGRSTEYEARKGLVLKRKKLGGEFFFLSFSDPVVQQRRKKFGGNKRRNYTEGWVEFADKRVAKAVAVTLNNTPVGGRKRHYYHDDLWNIKYLSKFRWTHLTEKKGAFHGVSRVG